MRKKIIVIFISLILIFSFAGCGDNQTEDNANTPNSDNSTVVDYAKLYQPILDRYYWNISNGYPNGEMNILQGEFFAFRISQIYENPLEIVGYAVEDINGDGIPELLMGNVDNENSIYPGNDIGAVFTIVDNQPVFLFEGWERNRYLYLGQGRFFNQMSSGAAYYGFSEIEIEENSADLIYVDHYFSVYEEETDSVVIYHNEDGFDVMETSEKTDWTTEEYFEAEEELAQGSVMVEMTAFSQYEFNGHGWYGGYFYADYVKNFEEGAAAEIDFEFVNSDQGDDNIVFCFDKAGVEEFSVVALDNFSLSEYGECYFDCEVMQEFGAIEKGQTVLIGEDIYGSIPNYGVMAKGYDGWVEQFAIQISGYDGSLVLMPFYKNINH